MSDDLVSEWNERLQACKQGLPPGHVRIISPDGDLCHIPEEVLEEALSLGARVMTSEDMANLFQSLHMAKLAFEDERKKRRGTDRRLSMRAQIQEKRRQRWSRSR